MDRGAWWAAVHGVARNWIRLSDFTFTFHFHALEKEMTTHSSVLTWRIPGTGEPGGLPSMESHRVGHDWRDLAAVAAVREEDRKGIQAKDFSVHNQKSMGNCDSYINPKIRVLLYFKQQFHVELCIHISYPGSVLDVSECKLRKLIGTPKRKHSRNRCNKGTNERVMRQMCIALIF